jgi:3-keto-5-aminohexanoate cleavage enzyme
MITCAFSGLVANRDQCPAIPYAPKGYAAEAKRTYKSGAAEVHIHARSLDGAPSNEVEEYRNIYDAVTAACPVIINFSTGAVGIPVDKKIAPVKEIKPAIGALNMGSMNYAKYHQGKKGFVFDFVFANPFSEITPLVSAMKENGVKPETECFDSGHIGNCFPLIDMGFLTPPYQFILIMGVLGGMPPTADNLAHQVRLLPPNSDWEVIGIRHDQWRMVATAIVLGGNVRVGLEDNFYIASGVMAKANSELAEKAARMIRDQSREVATVEECRERLGLKHRQGKLMADRWLLYDLFTPTRTLPL